MTSARIAASLILGWAALTGGLATLWGWRVWLLSAGVTLLLDGAYALWRRQ